MSTTEKLSYRYCLVPCCTNTTFTAPDKLFLNVPKDKTRRYAWEKVMKRDVKKSPALSSKTSRHVCEDHFSLEEDLENYWEWKIMGNVRIPRLKDGVVPQIFECQKKTLPPPERKAVQKRKRIELVQEALLATDETSSIESQPSLPGPSFESQPSSSRSFWDSSLSHIDEESKFEDKCIQVCLRKHFRSKGTNTCVSTTTTACSPLKVPDMPQNALQYGASIQYSQYSSAQPDVLEIDM